MIVAHATGMQNCPHLGLQGRCRRGRRGVLSDVVAGDPADVHLALAAQRQVDLLRVVGAHGLHAVAARVSCADGMQAACACRHLLLSLTFARGASVRFRSLEPNAHLRCTKGACECHGEHVAHYTFSQYGLLIEWGGYGRSYGCLGKWRAEELLGLQPKTHRF